MTEPERSGQRQLLLILGAMGLGLFILVLVASWAAERG
jgi:hypothetical protein